MTDRIRVTQEEYKRLKRCERILDALYEGGVDNWEWYGEAMSTLEEDDDED